MNTVHFFLQAVLSNVVVWRQESKVTMSWRDYLIRGLKSLCFRMHSVDVNLQCSSSLVNAVNALPSAVVPTAVGTALDINLSNVSLVFISVTFATMVNFLDPVEKNLGFMLLIEDLDGPKNLLFNRFFLQCKSSSPIFLLVFAFAFR